MIDEPVQPGMSARALDSLTDARRTVEVATDEVTDLGHHLGAVIERSRQPHGFLRLLEDMTRAAPLAMLGVAFVAGVLLRGGRRG